MTEKNPSRIVIGPARLSYCHLWEPHSTDPDEKPKYSCTLLLPKSDEVSYKKIKAAQKAALEIGKAKKFGGVVPKKLTLTLHDGDDEEEVDHEKNPEYKGHWYMAVRSSAAPGIIDRAKRPIENQEEVYSGCWAYVSVNAYPFDFKGKKGISFGLNHIMKVKDDDNLTGRTSADEDFADFEVDEDIDDDDVL